MHVLHPAHTCMAAACVRHKHEPLQQAPLRYRPRVHTHCLRCFQLLPMQMPMR